MDLDRLKSVLHAVSEETCNKNNIIEEIKQESQRRYFDFYQEWKRNNFDIDYKIPVRYDDNVIKHTTLSHLAIDCECEDIVDLLIANGASVNAVKDDYSCVFHNYSNNIHPASKIIKGYSLLHSAVKSNYERLAKFLIDKNVDVNVMAMNGYTPLHLTARNGDYNIVEVLVKNGANPLLGSLKGKISRALTEDQEIIEFLKKAESKHLFKSVRSGITCGSTAAFVAMAGCVGAQSTIAIIFTAIMSIACLGVMGFSKKAENKSLQSVNEIWSYLR